MGLMALAPMGNSAALSLGSQQTSTTANWSELSPSGELPSPRSNHAIVHDANRKEIVLFGGRDSSGFLNDAWAYSVAENSWRELITTGAKPAPRRTPTLIFDAENDRMLMYSGQGAGQLFNDTWQLDLNSLEWTELTLPSDPKPAERYGTVWVVDPATNGGLAFAGFTSEAGRFDDTWRFDLATNQWAGQFPQDTRPGRRCLHMAAFDVDRGRFYVYGGQRNGALNDLWAFDPESRIWSEFDTPTRPTNRYFGALIYSPERPSLLLYGGRGAGIFGDTWQFDPDSAQWQDLSQSSLNPGARHSHAGVYVPNLGFVISGGQEISGSLNDLWVMEL